MIAVNPARYAKGQLAVSCPSDGSGTNTRPMRLCHALGFRYSNRERAYIGSPNKVRKLKALIASGADAELKFSGIYNAKWTLPGKATP